ncbi:MAG TPA: TolC family outer membrane protein [Arenimonas sp.]|uniref:TolC family outer membrane protein n=1 Tax=Arenimonas sp. TaxID=1872635 RepID=UPI002CA4B746|nr:TolC family outer membrane protein [Arenimonas sp.]HMB56034.1 TolC family outer membrane protein [Arenimonas sp.]
MSLRLRPITFALLLAGISAQAHATDLMQAYDLARQSDPQFAASEAQRNASGEGVVQSRAALLPQISADVTYGESKGRSSGNQVFAGTATPINSTYSDSSSRGSGVNLQQSIYDHANYSRLGASKARARQANAQYDAASDALIVRVADAYFNVLTGIETLASARAEERSVKRQLDQAEKRLEVGLAPITDVHEARARYDSSRANAIASANALDDAYEALGEITGQPLENLKGLSTDYRPATTDTRTAEDWVKIATDTNPTLRSYQEALAAAEKDVSTARSGHYPTLSASASYSDDANWGDSLRRSFPASNPINSGSSSTGNRVGLTLSIPLFSGFATQSRVRQAIDQRDAAADQLEQQKRAITRQTRGAYRSLVAGQAEVEARRLAVVSAKAAYEAGEAGLEVGTRTIVDVLIAQQALFAARTEYARSRHAYLVNELRLKQAAGILEVSDLEATNRVLVANANDSLSAADSEDSNNSKK